MKPLWKTALLGGAALLTVGAASHAQKPNTPDAPPPMASQAPLYDPDQLPAIRGTVRQFTLTGRGDIDGLILTDGTEVKTPPHLSSQIAFAVKPGDAVVIHGLRAAALPLVRAVSVTDEATKRTVVDNGPGQGPPPPPRGPGAGPPPPPPRGPEAGLPPPPDGPGAGPPPDRNNAQTSGRVRMTLHGPEGDLNGALLDDGTVLRVPPREADRVASLLAPGETVFAEGNAVSSVLGKVMDVARIGASREELDDVAPAPPPGPPPGPPRPPRP